MRYPRRRGFGGSSPVFGQFRCPDCGSSQAYRSRRRNFVEKFLFPFLLIRPIRCANCFRRSRVFIFVSVLKRGQARRSYAA